jgi:hypothetical protein
MIDHSVRKCLGFKEAVDGTLRVLHRNYGLPPKRRRAAGFSVIHPGPFFIRHVFFIQRIDDAMQESDICPSWKASD